MQGSIGRAGWRPLQSLRGYQPVWIAHDLVAGLVLTTMLVPVGVAYAVASGVPSICGLYATIVPLLAYAVFGPSRILVLGPGSSLAALILGVVAPLSAGESVPTDGTVLGDPVIAPPFSPVVFQAAERLILHGQPAACVKGLVPGRTSVSDLLDRSLQLDDAARLGGKPTCRPRSTFERTAAVPGPPARAAVK